MDAKIMENQVEEKSWKSEKHKETAGFYRFLHVLLVLKSKKINKESIKNEDFFVAMFEGDLSSIWRRFLGYSWNKNG